jgi:hypothetical protein
MINCTISYHGRTIICGNKCTRTSLWMVPLTKNAGDQAASPTGTNHAPLTATPTTALAANVDTTSSTAKYACYIHQIMCSPPASTLLGALEGSEELATIPSLTPTLIKNHLPRSMANKGHMCQHQANTASTRNMQSKIIVAHVKFDCMFSPQEICSIQDVFCFAVLANAITGTMYTNITGAFPVRSFKSMHYVFVAYIYNLNAIIVWAMPSCTNASMVQAFTKVIGGYHPVLNVMDYKCSAAAEKYIRSKTINIQLVPPHNNRVNTAEHAVATFKEHFIAALVTMDMLCPLQLWDEFPPQVKLTLNMLHFSQQNPKKSANQEVYGSFDFNKTPLALLGTKSLIYNNPASRASCATCNRWLLCRICLQPLPLPPILHSRNTPFLLL